MTTVCAKFLLLGSLTIKTLAQTYQSSISNGTCYYGNDEKAEDTYIPCGNDAVFEGTTCCQVGDLCLSSNACFNARYGVTYLAGCTDPTYQSSKCPNKGPYSAQQWVGLVRCFVSNDTSLAEEQWAPCEDKNQPTISTADECDCDLRSDTPVFTDSPKLTNIAQLPLTASGTLSWFPDFEYLSETLTETRSLESVASSTTTPTGTVYTTSKITDGSKLSTVSSGGISPTAHINPQDNFLTPASSSGLPTGAKIGIGLGTGISAVAILGLLGGVYFRRKRQRERNFPDIKDQIRPYSRDGSFWGAVTSKKKTSPECSNYDSPYLGFKSELPADTSTTFNTPRTNIYTSPPEQQGPFNRQSQLPQQYPSPYFSQQDPSESTGSRGGNSLGANEWPENTQHDHHHARWSIGHPHVLSSEQPNTRNLPPGSSSYGAKQIHEMPA